MDVFVHGEKFDPILDLVGDTPILRLDKIFDKPLFQVHAKLEGFNPSGSIKDRIAKKMIEKAEEEGSLTEDKTILEPTSGNTGIGLAMVAIRKGYDATLVMPSSVSEERALMLKAFGADIIITPKNQGTDGSIRKAEKLLKNNDKYWMPNQFSNSSNINAHYEGTGPEIWEYMGNKITHLVTGLGTGGTITGTSKYLKEKKPSIKVIGVKPKTKNGIQGLKNMNKSIVPDNYRKELLDEIIKVKPEETYQSALKLAREEGIFVGQSSGAVIQAIKEISKRSDQANIVTIFPDLGFKYLTSEPYRNNEMIKKLREAKKQQNTVKI